MSRESERLDEYAKTLSRIELDIALVDRDVALLFIAISLKRIADFLEFLYSEIKVENRILLR